MSYTLALQCGCVVYVSCNPKTQVAHTRVIESVGVRCTDRRHERGSRVFLWELLPGDTDRGGDVNAWPRPTGS